MKNHNTQNIIKPEKLWKIGEENYLKKRRRSGDAIGGNDDDERKGEEI